MLALEDMLPHAQSYLHGFTLRIDEGLPDSPMEDWMPLPQRWKWPDYSCTIPDSRIIGYEGLVAETTFNRDDLATESSRRLFVADGCIGPRCPFFYFEVTIQAEVPLNSK